jgi:hypothetical protein
VLLTFIVVHYIRNWVGPLAIVAASAAMAGAHCNDAGRTHLPGNAVASCSTDLGT